MLENRFRFIEKMVPYGTRTVHGWGGFYVENRARSGRSRPLHPGPCPLCGTVIDPQHTRPMSFVRFGEKEYVVIENHNPIVDDQLLIFPHPAHNPLVFLDHRIDLNATDVALIIRLTTEGFSHLPCECDDKHPPVVRMASEGSPEAPYSQPWAVYVNALPGSGRSVSHLHINCVPAHYVPLPSVNPAPWQVCQDMRNGTVISRLAGTSFYALVVEGDSSQAIAETLARLHEAMNEWEIPYNLIAYPLNLEEPGPKGMRIAVVPRGQEYCEAADQRIAGLEFLTGALIPGISRLESMDTIQRDLAFWQATLKDEHQLVRKTYVRK